MKGAAFFGRQRRRPQGRDGAQAHRHGWGDVGSTPWACSLLRKETTLRFRHPYWPATVILGSSAKGVNLCASSISADQDLDSWLSPGLVVSGTFAHVAEGRVGRLGEGRSSQGREKQKPSTYQRPQLLTDPTHLPSAAKGTAHSLRQVPRQPHPGPLLALSVTASHTPHPPAI